MCKRKNVVYISLISILLLTTTLLTSCSNEKEEKKDKPLVYTSFYPIYDLASQVALDSLDIRTFMPINQDPHFWEPTAKDMKRLAQADMLIVNGANMERWLDSVRSNLPDLKIVVLSESIPLITYKGACAIGDFRYMAQQQVKKNTTYKIDFAHTHENTMRICFIKKDDSLSKKQLIKKAQKVMEQKGEVKKQKSTIKVKPDTVYTIEMGHDAGFIDYIFDESGTYYFVSDRESEKILSYNILYNDGNKIPLKVELIGSTSSLDKITYDPHSWLGINNAKTYLNIIYKEFVNSFGKEHFYYKNKVKAVSSLTKLEVKFKEKFKNLDSKEFVVTHYAYEYLAQDFGLVQYPLQSLVSMKTPSLKTIKKAILYCKYKHINTIFYETNISSKEATSLAQEIKGVAVPLTSMEYVKSNEYKIGGYTKIMEDNLEKIYTSLKK